MTDQAIVGGEERARRAREVLAAEFVRCNPGWAGLPSTNLISVYCALNAMLTYADEVSGIGELREAVERWKPIELAPKDGTYILAIVAPNESRHLEHQTGRMFVIRHEGKTENGFDLGWSVYPGYGGASDHNFTHFSPLPSPPDIDRSGLAQEVE